MRLITLASCFALALAAQGCKTAPKNDAAKPAPAASAKASVDANAAKVSENAKDATKKAGSSETALMNTVTCQLSGEERVLEVVQQDGAGCTVNYTKASETKEIASAQHDATYCQGVVAKVRGTLETAGYACK